MKLKRNKIFIIAEAGVNHNGNFQKAIKMVDAAKFAGADAIKFQTVDTELVHNKKYTNKKFFNFSKSLSFTINEYKKIKNYCDKKKIEFMSTPFDKKSVEILYQIGLKRFKVSSANINNYPLLEKIKKFKKEIILSTGMATEKNIQDSLNFVGRDMVTLLHCVSLYPTPNNKVNLNRITSLKKKFKLPTGFSDHSQGIGAPISSVSLGISMLEKHFKLNENDFCPDSELSITPEKFKIMVESINEAAVSFGSGDIIPGKEERKRKINKIPGVYFSKSKNCGEILKPDDIILQSPTTKFNYNTIKKFFKKKLQQNVIKGDPVLIHFFKKK